MFKKLNYPLAPPVLALILGPFVERSLRQTLIMSKGSAAIFFTRPICAVFLALTVLAFFCALVTENVA